MRFKRSKRLIVGVVASLSLLLGSPLLAACDKGTTTVANCGYKIGDGSKDAQVHQVVYPGQSIDIGQDQKMMYVPCNSRNYITNDGTQQNANGETIGDRKPPTLAFTKSGTPIRVWTTVEWTLNQSDKEMREFYAFCLKYNCASDKDKGGDANSSTPGWNRMLSENLGPVVDADAMEIAHNQVDDSIWQKPDPAAYKTMGDAMTLKIKALLQQQTGDTDDLFCGSGSSWPDPTKPGSGTFNCTAPRVTVNRVELDTTIKTGPGAIAANAERLEAAKALYGDSASFWLGLQDAIKECKDDKVPCMINLGGPGSPSLPLPTGVPSK